MPVFLCLKFRQLLRFIVAVYFEMRHQYAMKPTGNKKGLHETCKPLNSLVRGPESK